MQNFLDMLDNADDDWALTDIYIYIEYKQRHNYCGKRGGGRRVMISSEKFLFVDHPIEDHNEREFKPLITS